MADIKAAPLGTLRCWAAFNVILRRGRIWGCWQIGLVARSIRCRFKRIEGLLLSTGRTLCWGENPAVWTRIASWLLFPSDCCLGSCGCRGPAGPGCALTGSSHKATTVYACSMSVCEWHLAFKKCLQRRGTQWADLLLIWHCWDSHRGKNSSATGVHKGRRVC